MTEFLNSITSTGWAILTIVGFLVMIGIERYLAKQQKPPVPPPQPEVIIPPSSSAGAETRYREPEPEPEPEEDPDNEDDEAPYEFSASGEYFIEYDDQYDAPYTIYSIRSCMQRECPYFATYTREQARSLIERLEKLDSMEVNP